MQRSRRPFVGGNWKMNTDLAAGVELAEDALAALAAGGLEQSVDVAVFPPFPYLQSVGRALGHSNVLLGGQDCSAEASGAFTGQVSAAMLCDLGARSVIIGHSERRHGLGEDDDLLREKLAIALESGLVAVLCVGETLSQRDDGRAEAVVAAQLRGCFGTLTAEAAMRVVVAYEPVWAIGTGRTASPDDAQAMHASIRGVLGDLYDSAFAARTRVIYGGSVNAKNARAIFDRPDVDGGLIGGASLKADDFVSICRAAAEAWSAT
ncbi:MAG: triose-phosphate isomerase [Phycisphaerales bacterium]|nr:triose-phosphate isomerase [Phycisphaerales bacterium]